ncbi:hypothetical protein Mapa_009772 [Marchantia paleacea]|nr:hypothetical protein Mapa_009772 [Marchantia paleacea]
MKSTGFHFQEEEESSCVRYDNRKRPWYNGAISHPNYLIILVDCGNTMSEDATVQPLGNRLEAAIGFSMSLMDTVYKNNYINVGAADDDSPSQSVNMSKIWPSSTPRNSS